MNSPTFFMELAIALGEKARFWAPPNPWVGCVIVKNNQIVGQGSTQPPGQQHAEVCALKEAQELSKGASLFVTLEPCPHQGKTSPCTQAIIQAGISNVYIGVEDPDSRVSGRGIEILRKAGINVFIGICKEKIAHSLKPYLHHRKTGLPYTVLKTAISLDGRIAAPDGSSKWITCEEARKDVHIQRALSQAILIGANTALADAPQLTVRHSEYTLKQQPLRILLDSNGRVPVAGPLFDQGLAPTLVITTSKASSEKMREWEKKGIDVQVVSASGQGVDLFETWRLIGERSIVQVLVEGGASLHTSLLKASLYQELLVYVGALLIGLEGKPAFLHHINHLKEAKRLTLHETKQIGQTVRLLYSGKLSNNMRAK